MITFLLDFKYFAKMRDYSIFTFSKFSETTTYTQRLKFIEMNKKRSQITMPHIRNKIEIQFVNVPQKKIQKGQLSCYTIKLETLSQCLEIVIFFRNSANPL